MSPNLVDLPYFLALRKLSARRRASVALRQSCATPGIRDEGKEEAGACFVRVVDSFWGEEVNTEVLAVGARPRQKGGDVREQSSVDGGEIG